VSVGPIDGMPDGSAARGQNFSGGFVTCVTLVIKVSSASVTTGNTLQLFVKSMAHDPIMVAPFPLLPWIII